MRTEVEDFTSFFSPLSYVIFCFLSSETAVLTTLHKGNVIAGVGLFGGAVAGGLFADEFLVAEVVDFHGGTYFVEGFGGGFAGYF